MRTAPIRLMRRTEWLRRKSLENSKFFSRVPCEMVSKFQMRWKLLCRPAMICIMSIRLNPFIRALCFGFALVVISTAARAQEWSLTTADLNSSPVLLRGLSADGFRVAGIDGKTERTIPPDQFVSVQRPAVDEPPTPNFTLMLSNGDRLVGDPGAVVGERLTWLSPSLGKVSVPFNRLVAVSRGLNFSVPDEPPKQDVATLANGDSVAGVFTGCADQKITIQADAGPVAIPLDSVKRIAFAPTNAAADESHAYRIHLSDGTRFTVADVSFDGDQLKVTLKGKTPVVVSVPPSTVLGIEQINGPIGWLSSQIPTENVQTPYLSGAQTWPAKFDLAVDGAPLSFDGRTYDRGIGVHAYSRLTFAIDPQWTAFRTQYAIDSHRDEPRKYADVTVRIKLDDKVVHEEKHVHEGVISNLILFELKGARTLTLECDYGDAGDTQAHLDWLQPALLRSLPVPVVTPTAQPATQPGTQPVIAPAP